MVTLFSLLAGCVVAPQGTPEVVAQPGQEGDTAAPEAAADASRYGGTLVRQMMGITQFDPIYIEDSTFYAAPNIFSTLFRIDSQTGEAYPRPGDILGVGR